MDSKTKEDAMGTALITGITGQDGSCLARFLLSKGYKVYGLDRRRSTSTGYVRIEDILNQITLLPGDLTDITSIASALKIAKPTEVYNLGAMSFVRRSYDEPLHTFEVTGKGALNVFEACRQVNKSIKIYQASSSEMFGAGFAPQGILSPFHPRSPYGVAKVAAHFAAINYRESYGMFIACGILFNHESEWRGEEFVTRKITKAVARIKAGLQDKLELGNLNAKRDWGYAPEYMEAAWMMLQYPKACDWIIGTSETHTVLEWVQECFKLANLDFNKYVTYNKEHERSAEVHVLQADIRETQKHLKWNPKIKFKQLVKIMLENDMKELGLKLEKRV